MLADQLDRIVEKLGRELVRALRNASRAELSSLLPGAFKESAPKGKARRAPARSAPKPAPAKRSAKPAAKRPSSSSAAAKRGAGSLTRQLLSLLKVRREGFRSEEIQRRLKVDAEELKDTLARLVTAGRVERHGQARGMRYSLPSVDGADGAPSSADFVSPAAPKAAEPAAPPFDVTEQHIDEIRLMLADSSTPLAMAEFQAKLPHTRDQLKSILDHMLREGFVERVRSGPHTRYSLHSHAPKKGQADQGVRPIRRRHETHGEEQEITNPPPPARTSAPADDEPLPET